MDQLRDLMREMLREGRASAPWPISSRSYHAVPQLVAREAFERLFDAYLNLGAIHEYPSERANAEKVIADIRSILPPVRTPMYLYRSLRVSETQLLDYDRSGVFRLEHRRFQSWSATHVGAVMAQGLGLALSKKPVIVLSRVFEPWEIAVNVRALGVRGYGGRKVARLHHSWTQEDEYIVEHRGAEEFRDEDEQGVAIIKRG